MWLISLLFLLLGVVVVVVALMERPSDVWSLPGRWTATAASRAVPQPSVVMLSAPLPTAKLPNPVRAPRTLAWLPAVTPSAVPPVSPLARFDVVYYINLDHRVDRRHAIEQELDTMHVPAEQRVRIPGVIPPERRGTVGCTMAHINTLRHFLAHTAWTTAVILEDDFQFLVTPDELAAILDAFMAAEPHWDVIMLAGNVERSQKCPADWPAWKVLNASTTSGYAFTRSMAEKLLANFEEGLHKLRQRPKHKGYFLDLYWHALQPQHRWYILKPLVGSQRESYSDINHRVKEIKSKVKHSSVSSFATVTRRAPPPAAETLVPAEHAD